jgi:hypothetical protein
MCSFSVMGYSSLELGLMKGLFCFSWGGGSVRAIAKERDRLLLGELRRILFELSFVLVHLILDFLRASGGVRLVCFHVSSLLCFPE